MELVLHCMLCKTLVFMLSVFVVLFVYLKPNVEWKLFGVCSNHVCSHIRMAELRSTSQSEVDGHAVQARCIAPK